MEPENRPGRIDPDQIPYFQGSILRSGLKSGLKGIVKVSFEVQQKIIAHEARKERYEAFSGIEEHLLTVSDLLKAESAFKEETEFNKGSSEPDPRIWIGDIAEPPCSEAFQWRNAENAAGPGSSPKSGTADTG
ncbi:MAG: hypothetical protein Ct9H90mP8_2710 [Pseudomonadota bacterium]|nr:MAG: hypothetical protein Ct9H90mP8_2710 [Pseudomonadota bacterium]